VAKRSYQRGAHREPQVAFGTEVIHLHSASRSHPYEDEEELGEQLQSVHGIQQLEGNDEDEHATDTRKRHIITNRTVT
jgi:translation elongation factor EF-1beta